MRIFAEIYLQFSKTLIAFYEQLSVFFDELEKDSKLMKFNFFSECGQEKPPADVRAYRKVFQMQQLIQIQYQLFSFLCFPKSIHVCN